MKMKKEVQHESVVNKVTGHSLYKTLFYNTIYRGHHAAKAKVSAIRGGIGEMLLRANCVRGRECESCDFESEVLCRGSCTQSMKKPSFVTTGESVGYVLECDNYKEEFYQGDQLSFQLILFGKNIVYFNQYLQAISMLGASGLGKHQAFCDHCSQESIPTGYFDS